MSHWAEQYVGLPWRRGATGPDAYDCYGLARHVLRQHYGRALPDIDSRQHTSRAFTLALNEPDLSWLPAAAPADGRVVIMYRGRWPTHIGVVIKADNALRCLHAIEPSSLGARALSGVVAQKLDELQISGWARVLFYKSRDDADA